MVAGSVAVPVTRERFALEVHLRRFAAASCAAVVVGALVGGLGGRLVMRLLAVADPATSGLVTDDGFEVGRITAGGTVLLVAAGVQIALVGTLVYLLVRPLLMGPPWLRVATVALGAGTTVGALLVEPDSFDFQAFDPPMLPVALFVALPVVHVAVFATLTERWIAEGSWFMRAPLRHVAPTLVVWVLGAFALVLVVPVAAAALALLLLVHRRPPGATTRSLATWAGRAGLVGIFAVAVLALSADIVELL
jgi:hypothetical protein